ncbi:esterase/lipase family protein [Aspergillus undulatus]|uniref:esterase/lipase family protein n=1 Tax=Aspergillus undulatus TaxID=1810928 RepID=UPI003CCD1689
MKKTLLLVFVHGFKGGDDTFGDFPQRLQTILSRKLPNISVVTLVYPKYETRGNLQETVNVFREWLQNQVIDLEVANGTASPTVDPSVHVYLVGHSMGGIVAADTLLLLASEQPIPPRMTPQSSHHEHDEGSEDGTAASSTNISESGSFMFPHIQGVFAFDTPYLGIAPGVVSYGAEGHYKNITSTYNAFSEVAGLFGYGGNNASNQKSPTPSIDVKGSLPAASDADAAATPSWQRWGRYAMFAGAAGAVAAGGAAAMYSQRQRLTDSWDWVSSHLTFVGCLTRRADLDQRISQLSQVRKDRGVKSVNFYTCLGKAASSLVENNVNQTGNSPTQSFSSRIIRSKDRTFCTLPDNSKEAHPDKPIRLGPGPGLEWVKAVNDRATDEIKAHTCMFLPKQNPAFSELINVACTAMVRSVDRGWYSTARGQAVHGNHDAGDDTNMPRPEQDRTHNRAKSGTFDGNDGDEDVVVI